MTGGWEIWPKKLARGYPIPTPARGVGGLRGAKNCRVHKFRDAIYLEALVLYYEGVSANFNIKRQI